MIFRYCGNVLGSMQSYFEKLKGFGKFMIGCHTLTHSTKIRRLPHWMINPWDTRWLSIKSTPPKSDWLGLNWSLTFTLIRISLFATNTAKDLIYKHSPPGHTLLMGGSQTCLSASDWQGDQRILFANVNILLNITNFIHKKKYSYLQDVQSYQKNPEQFKRIQLLTESFFIES